MFILALVACLCLVFGMSACDLFGNSVNNAGETEQTPSDDGESQTPGDGEGDEIDEEVHTHTLQYVEAVSATCTEGDNTEYWYCVDCNKYYSDETATTEIAYLATEIAVLGHNLTTYEGQAATCTESGWAEYVTCSRCYYSTYEEIPVTGHTASEAVKESEVSATCTADGSYDEVVYCTVCKAEISRNPVTVSATGNSYFGWEFVDDETHQRECEVCGNIEYDVGGKRSLTKNRYRKSVKVIETQIPKVNKVSTSRRKFW